MIRKIIQIAQNTNVVTLPKYWCTSNNIKKGDEVILETSGSKITIDSNKLNQLNDSILKTTIDLSNSMPMTSRIVGALIKSGYDELKIIFSEKIEKSEIEKSVDDFIGFEIILETENTIIVKKIIDENISEFDNMLRRIFYIIKYIGTECYNLLSDNYKEDSVIPEIILENIYNLSLKDKEINKLANFARRALNKGCFSERKTHPLYHISEELEKIGDEYRELFKYIGSDINRKLIRNNKNNDNKNNYINNNNNNNDIKNNVINYYNNISKDDIKLLNEVNSFFGVFYDCFYSFSIEKITNIGKEHLRLKLEINSSIKSNLKSEAKKSNIILYYLRDILERTYSLNGSIMASNL